MVDILMNENNGRLVSFGLVLTPSGFPAWCWLQARPRCWLLGYIFYFSVISVLFWLSCVSFGIRANIGLSKVSHSQSRTKKKSPQKKKKKKSLSIVFSPPKSCLCRFSTWSKKFAIQLCFPVQKIKIKITEWQLCFPFSYWDWMAISHSIEHCVSHSTTLRPMDWWVRELGLAYSPNGIILQASS